VEGIEVCAQTSTGEYVGRCSATNASGEYAVTELNTGEYKLYFTANGHNYLPQYYNGKKSLSEGELVAVTLGSTTPGINVAMQPGGKITGTVTASVSKAPIQAISVCAFTKSGGIVSCANTNSSGEYAIIALTTGEYIVAFTGAGQNYIAQYYNGKATYGEAEAVSVTAGATHEKVTAALEVGGEITGLVTAAKTSAPLASVEAEAYKSNGEYIAAAPTNAKGEYTIVGLPTGELKVAFYSFTQEYKTQYYNGKENFSEATGVPTTAGGHVTPNINAALLTEPPVLISPPTISGTAVEGHKLTVAHGSWKNEPTEYTEQWLRCNSEGQSCETIEGASKQEYVPVFADVGHELRVKEAAHNEGGTGGPVTSEPTAPVAVAPPENTKVPSITGTAQQGKTLNDVAGKWTNEPTKAKYQWLRCNEAGTECKAIATAIASSDPVTEEDVGHTLRVEETAENAAGPGSPATSAQTEVVVPPMPVNTAAPTITGTAQQGKELTEHHGAWKYAPTKYKLQWLQCEKLGKGCLPITGATGETYIPGPLEVGGTIRVEEAATNAGGTSEYVMSEATAEVLPAPPVNISAPTLTGTAQQGKELTEHHGAWENNPTSYKVEWLRCNKEGEECSPFSTTSEEKYVPEAIDVDHTIRVSEVAKNAGGPSKPTLSNPTPVVVPPVPVLEVLPTITGTTKQGDKLTLHHGKWSNAPSGYQDQWLRCKEAGKECETTGATGETYELTSKDVKHKLRVEEIAENEGGPSQPATSEPTAVVVSSVPEIESPPTITGTAQQGKELSGHHGEWSNEPTGYTDTWVRCNEAGKECETTGATGESYVPVAKDVGHTLRLEEVAHNEGGPSTPALSEPTAVVLPPAPTDVTLPTVTGEAVQGKTLTEHHGTWEPAPTGYKLQWLQCEEAGEGCLPIGGANGETYKPTSLDLVVRSPVVR
jgi:Carboxypeptidase regulatory-like domain/Ig domain of plant-specific actin-binding protein